jgi:hypothetical protein
MARAMHRGTEYELLNVTEDAEYVLRDEEGDVLVFEESDRERVQVQCELCGRWSSNVIPHSHSGRWVCADRPCYDSEGGA